MRRYCKGSTVLMSGLLLALLSPAVVLAEEEAAEPKMYATFWSLLPPVVAIILALVTKEVYSSLFAGIILGALFYSDFSFTGMLDKLTKGGLIASIAEPDNAGILIFLVILGSIVALMNKSGGSAAFGRWAGEHIHTRVGAQLATILLGVLIFIDDYFNCLTVGSVMRPVTDGHKVSRAKLAYLIDATAAPVCIIAPVSSWAAAVSSYLEGDQGIGTFLKTIPYNFYALLTIVMMITMAVMKFEFGPMAKHERNALAGDLFTSGKKETEDQQQTGKGAVIDLVFPILVLIAASFVGMIYSGEFFDSSSEFYMDLIGAFSNSVAAVGLTIGGLVAILISIIFYLVRRVLTFRECMDSIPEGFKAMVPAILILVFAWTLNGMTQSLGVKAFVADNLNSAAGGFANFLPAIIFVIGLFISFSTGTSWGTFGIMIPIVAAVFANNQEMMVISISACMAGAVCGDHCSPISDTTIMASAGAQCDHVNHVSTQLPYAMVAAAVSFVSYLIAGFVRNAWICLIIAIVLMIGTLFILRRRFSGSEVS